MNIQWYPGHMTKARRMMQENIKLVDVVVELVDARVPVSSRNPEMAQITNNKPRFVVLNKIDLADPKRTAEWIQKFKEESLPSVCVNARTGEGLPAVLTAAREACKDKIARDKRRGMMNRPIRAMIVGIPNVGKSTFINKLVGRATAKTGNKPGVTKGKQWIKIKKDIELLDTPGILWPKFEDRTVGLRLAFIGSIREEILDAETLALELVRFFKNDYRNDFLQKYPIEDFEGKEPHDILREMAKMRNLLASHGEPDVHRLSKMFLEEFRNGKMGSFTLE
ncbi:ribosome biogenesis GTPase YlqF [Anaerotalea alkaliphila]|uniref:Ribosome biogenesis GTPase A n=1 Tax=Anaerotalea alkaliphila TaxID=2662126 RepID=A0A7X5KNM5_9FIRM|nr:ribosome biogenesis GTPase YlqF [Anaerotalea alkaliphila]NDL68174.1 ribosome biogenesis GTPase YlqF [Anaerotalea alkaliphila]